MRREALGVRRVVCAVWLCGNGGPRLSASEVFGRMGKVDLGRGRVHVSGMLMMR